MPEISLPETERSGKEIFKEIWRGHYGEYAPIPSSGFGKVLRGNRAKMVVFRMWKSVVRTSRDLSFLRSAESLLSGRNEKKSLRGFGRRTLSAGDILEDG